MSRKKKKKYAVDVDQSNRREDEAYSLLQILKNVFSYDTGALLAEILDTNEVAVSRFCTGEKAEIGTLVPVTLRLMFPTTSGIAFEAQCAEYDLRKAHFNFIMAQRADTPTDDLRDAFDKEVDRAALLLETLRERYSELTPPATKEKADERSIDLAALESLEAQLATYAGHFELGAAAFDRAIEALNDTPRRHFGAQVLATRAMLNFYHCCSMTKVDVCDRVADPAVVRMARDVATVTSDARILILVAEATASIKEHRRAAKLLHEAALLRSMPIENLPTFQPIGYTQRLCDIAEFKEALALVPEVAALAEAAKQEKRAAATDHAGVPDDATLHRPR